MNHEKTIYTKIINYCLFFSLAFLLCTKNFTVGIVAVLLLTSLFYIVRNHKNLKLSPSDKLVIAILSAYFIASIPVYFKDMETTRYFKGSARYLLFIPIYFLIKHEIKNSHLSRKHLDVGIFIGSLGTLAIALYQAYILDMERVGGFLYSINFAYLSCSLAFLALVLSKDSSFKVFLFSAFMCNVISTLLTETRGAIFAIPILFFLIIFFYREKGKFKRISFFSLIIITISVISYHSSTKLKNRIDFTVNEIANIYNGNIGKAESSGARLDLWYSAIQSFKESPLIGQTYGERERKLNNLFYDKKISSYAVSVKRAHAHNQYFEMLASYGILGVIAFIFLLFVPLIFFLKRIYQSNYAFTGFIFVSGFILFCMTEVPLEQNLISTYYGLILVILIVFTNLDIENNRIYP